MKTNIPKLIAALALASLAGPAIGADVTGYSSKPWLTPEPRETFTIAVLADAEYVTATPFITSKPWIPPGQPDSRVYVVAVGRPGSFGATEQSSKPWLQPIRTIAEFRTLHSGDRVALVCSACDSTTLATVGDNKLSNLRQGRDTVVYTCDVCGAEGCCYVIEPR